MKIIDLGINGEGIGKENGKVYFVKNALPFEDVEVEVLKENKNFSFAKATNIKTKSPDRAQPLCPYFFKCGGCQLQHMSYEKQLEFKQNLVKNTLKKVGNIDASVNKTVPSDDIYFYRNKSVFPVSEIDKNVFIGMFEENSHKLVDVTECKIAKKGINKILALSRECFKSCKKGALLYIVVREINNQFLITLVATTKNIETKSYIEKLKQEKINFSLSININKNKNIIMSDDFLNVYGENFIRLNEFDLRQKISPQSFMQINDSVKKKLYQKVLSKTEQGETVVDAYCGAGLLSAMISRKVKYVYGIEISKQATKNANDLAIENKINNITFICGDCKVEIPKLLKNIEEDFTIILDPPRSGCDPLVLSSVLDVKPSKVIYVSCNPITLAKDLKILSSIYKIEDITPFDMFPQTSNVETMVVLKKSSSI